MSDPNEPQLSDEQRARWANEVALLRENGIWPKLGPELLLAVAARLAFLESERAHLHERADRATAELLALGRELHQTRAALIEEQENYRLLADHIEKVLPVRDGEEAEVALLMTAIDDVVRERDQARAEVWEWRERLAERCKERDEARQECDQARAEAERLRAGAQIVSSMGMNDLVTVARERDRAVAEAAVILDALTKLASADNDVLTSEVARRMHQIAVAALIHKPLAAHAAAVLKAVAHWARHVDAVGHPSGMPVWIPEQQLEDAWNAYCAALAGKEPTV